MYWWPKYRPKNNDSVEPDDVNEVWQTLWDELVGNLDEHNFNSNAFAADDFAAGAATAVARVHQAIFLDDTVHEGATRGSASYYVPRDGIWHVVGDDATPWTLSLADLPPGELEILVSFQITVDLSLGIVPYGPELQAAIDLDGAMIPETVTGTLEPEQDVLAAQGTSSGINTTEVAWTGAGAVFVVQPVVLSAVVPIPGGDHTVRVLVKGPVTRFMALGPDETETFGACKNCEIVAIWRH